MQRVAWQGTEELSANPVAKKAAGIPGVRIIRFKRLSFSFLKDEAGRKILAWGGETTQEEIPSFRFAKTFHCRNPDWAAKVSRKDSFSRSQQWCKFFHHLRTHKNTSTNSSTIRLA
jgi:hypothetical protein